MYIEYFLREVVLSVQQSFFLKSSKVRDTDLKA